MATHKPVIVYQDAKYLPDKNRYEGGFKSYSQHYCALPDAIKAVMDERLPVLLAAVDDDGVACIAGYGQVLVVHNCTLVWLPLDIDK
jgi:hypothetical protein